jgi:ferrous iron transport protein B
MTTTGNKLIRVALAGQPNVGKSTVFNLLTGLNQHVGNWPGKTVEQKSGTCNYREWTFDLIDLPGTYSLSANSPEELVTREYIIREKPDVVVAVLDATALERNLYLVSELLPLPAPVIVALNMVDVAEQQGLKIEPHVLEAALGVPVVPLIATKGRGIQELLTHIQDVVCGNVEYRPNIPSIRADHQEVLEQIEALLGDCIPADYPRTWVALKILEGDKQLTAMLRECLPAGQWSQVHSILRQHEDACVAVASGRYEWIARMIRAAVVKPRSGQITLTDQLDRWATDPFWGLAILAGILGVTFWLTYAIGMPLQRLIDQYIVHTAAVLAGHTLASTPTWVRGLVVNGMINGVGMVVSFFPILVIFFAVLGTLEDVGYMSRGAYVMDRFMHWMGLHGKSFLPLFLGFGCNVPAVMGTRVIESARARLLTILIAPLVPCTGRMAVVAFLAPAFFSAPTLVSWGLLAINLLVLALSGVLINKVFLKGEHVAFIMELPLYHLPNLRTIGLATWQRLVSFLRKAGTVILVVSVIVWLLSTLPHGNIESSLLANFGRALEPVGKWMGLDWRMIVALLSSFVAKENAIATLGVLFGTDSQVRLTTLLRSALTPAAALAFLVVQMLFVPCVATVGAIKQETNSWRWAMVSVLFLLVVSLLGGVLTYQVASRLLH